MFEKISEDILEAYHEKLEFIKEANSLRDAIRLGKISPRTFDKLRKTKSYLSFDEYNNLGKLDKETYKQNLLKELKSKLRGGNSPTVTVFSIDDVREALAREAKYTRYNDFMKNFNGDFTKEQYNDFFGGDQTHFPSMRRMAEGIYGGVMNRIDDTNRKIEQYNRTGYYGKRVPANFKTKQVKEQDQLPSIKMGPKNPNGASTTIKYEGLLAPTRLSSLTIHEDTRGAMDDLYRRSKAKLLGNIDNTDDYYLAERAGSLEHEFNEALTELYNTRRGYDYIEDWIPFRGIMPRIGSLLNDTHGSAAQVIGNEILTLNALYGSPLRSPLGLARALRSYPVKSPIAPNSFFNNLAGQALGIDFSKSGGGIGGRFNSMKEYKKYLNKIRRNEYNMLMGEDTKDIINNIRIHRIANKGLTDEARTEVEKMINKYYPDWNTKVTNQDINDYQKRIIELIREHNNLPVNYINMWNNPYGIYQKFLSDIETFKPYFANVLSASILK